MHYNDDMIHTDEKGRPLERPEKPGPNATTGQIIDWMRAVNAYNDRVTGMANEAFSKTLRS